MLPQVEKNALGAYRESRCDSEGNLCVVPPSSGLPFRFFLTAVGDGSGVYNLNGNYSAAPADFYYQSTGRYEIYTLSITVSDATKFNQPDYGGITAGVTNGVKFFFVSTTGVEIPIITNTSVKHNYEWIEVASSTDLTSFEGTAQTLHVALDLKSLFGRAFNLDAGERILVRLNDDFTGLVSHTFRLQGTLF